MRDQQNNQCQSSKQNKGDDVCIWSDSEKQIDTDYKWPKSEEKIRIYKAGEVGIGANQAQFYTICEDLNTKKAIFKASLDKIERCQVAILKKIDENKYKSFSSIIAGHLLRSNTLPVFNATAPKVSFVYDTDPNIIRFGKNNYDVNNQEVTSSLFIPQFSSLLDIFRNTCKSFSCTLKTNDERRNSQIQHACWNEGKTQNQKEILDASIQENPLCKKWNSSTIIQRTNCCINAEMDCMTPNNQDQCVRAMYQELRKVNNVQLVHFLLGQFITGGGDFSSGNVGLIKKNNDREIVKIDLDHSFVAYKTGDPKQESCSYTTSAVWGPELFQTKIVGPSGREGFINWFLKYGNIYMPSTRSFDEGREKEENDYSLFEKSCRFGRASDQYMVGLCPRNDGRPVPLKDPVSIAHSRLSIGPRKLREKCQEENCEEKVQEIETHLRGLQQDFSRIIDEFGTLEVNGMKLVITSITDTVSNLMNPNDRDHFSCYNNEYPYNKIINNWEDYIGHITDLVNIRVEYILGLTSTEGIEEKEEL